MRNAVFDAWRVAFRFKCCILGGRIGTPGRGDAEWAGRTRPDTSGQNRTVFCDVRFCPVCDRGNVTFVEMLRNRTFVKSLSLVLCHWSVGCVVSLILRGRAGAREVFGGAAKACRGRGLGGGEK